jgi:hypothetical protein
MKDETALKVCAYIDAAILGLCIGCVIAAFLIALDDCIEGLNDLPDNPASD